MVILGLCVSVPVLIVLAFVVNAARGSSHRVMDKLALVRMSSIHATFGAYAVQYGDVPPTVGWDNALVNSGSTFPAALEHPSLPRGSGSIGYVYIHRAPAIPGDGRDPSKTIVMYERSSLIKRGTYNILYLDGSIVTYPKPQFEAIIKAGTDDAGAPLPPP